MVASGLLVAATLGYMVWQAATLPSGVMPEASVTRVETTPEGDVLVHVEVANPGSEGWRHVIVSVDCGETPPTTELANLPAAGRRDAILACPPGTAEPEASIEAFVRT